MPGIINLTGVDGWFPPPLTHPGTSSVHSVITAAGLSMRGVWGVGVGGSRLGAPLGAVAEGRGGEGVRSLYVSESLDVKKKNVQVKVLIKSLDSSLS